MIKIPNSMTKTRMTGRETDFNTAAIIKKINTMETTLTTLKSRSVIVIKSCVQGASPISIAVGS